MSEPDEKTAFFAGVFTMPLIALLIAGSVLIRGWVLSLLWVWFVSAPFEVQPLGIAHCIGLGALLGATKVPVDCQRPERTSLGQLGKSLSDTFLCPLLTLLIGWVAKIWM